jgi:hypothetical protein
MFRPSLSAFRGRLLRAAGLGALAPFLCTYACGGTTIIDEIEDDAGSGGSTTTSTSSSTNGTTTTTGVTSGVTTGVGGAGGATPTEITCFGKNDPAPCPELSDAPTVYGYCTENDFEYIEQWVSGPYEENGLCCYEVVKNGPCGVGRPLRIDGRAVTAEARRGPNDWSSMRSAARPSTPSSPADRAVLRDGWLHDALFEHASAASFARFALELMALCAPPDLVRRAHQAAIDEVAHAELCFALASRHAGEPLGPGPVSLDGLEIRRDLATLARETVLEGCVGETVASLVAEAQLAVATDPEAREALTIIAADEARHAELAWATVAWAMRIGGERVRAAVAEAFAEAHRHLPTIHTAPDLTAHGRLDEATAARLANDALRQVVIPCAGALLAEYAGAPSAAMNATSI